MELYANIVGFISNYGYLAVFLGAVLEGEAMTMISGFLAHEGLLSFTYVILFGFLGATLGDSIWFLLGRHKGDKLLSKWPWFKRLTQKPIGHITKRPALVSFWLRFIYGLRHVLPFSLGVSKYPYHKFLFWNALGGLFWVITFASGGYLLGNILETFLGHLRRYQFVTVLLVIVVIVIFNLVAKLFKKSVENVVKEEIEVVK